MNSPYATLRRFADVGAVFQEKPGDLQVAPRTGFVQRGVSGVVLGRRRAVHFFQTVRSDILKNAIKGISTGILTEGRKSRLTQAVFAKLKRRIKRKRQKLRIYESVCCPTTIFINDFVFMSKVIK